MLRGEADNLASPIAGALDQRQRASPGPGIRGGRRVPQHREPVLEDHNVIVRRRDLRAAARPGRAQRALVSWRQDRAAPAPCREHHPLAQQRIPAQPSRRADALAGRSSVTWHDHRRQVPAVAEPRPAQAGFFIEVDDLAAVRKPPATAPDPIGRREVLRWPGLRHRHEIEASRQRGRTR